MIQVLWWIVMKRERTFKKPIISILFQYLNYNTAHLIILHHTALRRFDKEEQKMLNLKKFLQYIIGRLCSI